MNKTEIMNNVTRTFNKVSFKFKKHSPEILVVAGIVGTVASTVMACKATTKVNDILEDTKDQVDKVHYALDNPDAVKEGETYTEEDSKKDLAIIYIQSGVKFAKLYGPAVVLGVASITSILAGHNILRKRNVALAAAYATLDKGFKDYRGRVVERFGKELDRELRYNIKAETVEEKVVDEKGKEKTVEKTVEVVDPNTVSDYSKFFDVGNPNWSKDPEWNLTFLKKQQHYANDLLKSRGYLYLNEVYDMLAIPRTKAGQIVGWVYNEENPVGDNFVDFGIYDQANCKARDFVNGYERTILLDFNVDGNILDLM